MTVYSPHTHSGLSRFIVAFYGGAPDTMRAHHSPVRRFVGVSAILLLTGLFPGHSSSRVLLWPVAGASIAPADAAVSPESIFPTVLYQIGARSESVSARDLDGDGHVDLVLTDDNYIGPYYGEVVSLLGRGDGTFSPPRGSPAGDDPGYPRLGDFNSDGRPDVLVTNGYDEGVSIVLGDGHGTFGNRIVIPTSSVYSTAVGDFNQDHQDDLVIAHETSIEIRLGHGDGTFAPATVLGGAKRTFTLSLVLDFNGDGKLDLAISDAYIDSYNWVSDLVLFPGQGDGTFGAPVRNRRPDRATAIASGDLNGDGRDDIALIEDQYVVTLLASADGTVTETDRLPFYNWSYSVAMGDLDGDHIPDLIVGGNRGIPGGLGFDGVTAFQGHGDGTFGPPQDFGAGIRPTSIATADFDGDGRDRKSVV